MSRNIWILGMVALMTAVASSSALAAGTPGESKVSCQGRTKKDAKQVLESLQIEAAKADVTLKQKTDQTRSAK